MADTTLRILVEVEGGQAGAASIKGVATATEEAGTAAQTTSKKTGGLVSSLKGIATGIAVYKGYEYLKGAVTQTTELAKATAGLQRVTGLDTKTASGWVGVAEERGISTKQLSTSMATLGRNMASAQAGTKSSVKAFQQLGISQKDLSTMKTPEVMGKIADGLSKLPPGAQKAAMAQKLLGRSGQSLLPILNEGSKSLNEQIDSMGKSIGMTDKSKESALQMAKQQRELSASMLGVKVAIGTALIPILSAAAKAIEPLAAGFAKLMQQSPAFRIAIYALVAALTALKVVMFFGGTAATGGWIGLIIALGVALVEAYQHVTWFRNAVNAVFDFIKQHWQMLVIGLVGPMAIVVIQIVKHWQEIKAGAVAAFNAVKNVAVGAFNAVKGAINAVASAAKSVFAAVRGAVSTTGSTIRSVFTGAINAAKAAIDGVKGAASAAFGAVKSAVSTAVGAISGPFTGAWNALKTVIDAVKSAIDSVGSAAQTASDAVSKVTSLPGKALSLITGNAEGGYIPHTQMSLVGERGPEIVALPGGSTVIPNHRISIGGGGGVVHTHVYLNGHEIANALGEAVADQQAAR